MSLGTKNPSIRGERCKCKIKEAIQKHSNLTFKLEILVSTHYVLFFCKKKMFSQLWPQKGLEAMTCLVVMTPL